MHTPGSDIPLPQPPQVSSRAIVRHALGDTPAEVYGIVGPDYQLITAQDVCTIWDEFVGQPVETMGFLRGGKLFFVTSKLPTIDVNGDEVARYLGATAPMDGRNSATGEEWPLRVVCSNTLAMAQRRNRAEGLARYTVVHDATARQRMGEWLSELYTSAKLNTEVMQEAFRALANVRVDDTQADNVLGAAYPLARPARDNAPAEVVEQRQHRIDKWNDRVRLYRSTAKELFAGAGTGMDTPAAQGTAWGLYNAVVETEDYRRSWNGSGREAQVAAEQALFGFRAHVKKRAHAACLELVG